MTIPSYCQLPLLKNSNKQNTIGLVQQCPIFDVGHQQEIVIADGSRKELSIRVKIMPQLKVMKVAIHN